MSKDKPSVLLLERRRQSLVRVLCGVRREREV